MSPQPAMAMRVQPLVSQRLSRAIDCDSSLATRTGVSPNSWRQTPRGTVACTAQEIGSSALPAISAEKSEQAPEEQDYGWRVFSENQEDEDTDISLECDESGCVLIKKAPAKQEAKQVEEAPAGFLTCDLSGCFYDSVRPQNEFKVIEGTGWRLGYETAPDAEESFAAMVGAGGWSVALTAYEFSDFCNIIKMLRKGIITMEQDGVTGRDEIVMQVERGSVWMECLVPKKKLRSLQQFLQFGGRSENSAFEIRFILSGQENKRQAEGYWPAEAVMDMLRKLDQLTLEQAAAKEEAEASMGLSGEEDQAPAAAAV